MEMVRVLDRSDKTIKGYWHLFDILKGINNINAVWEEMSVNCLDGVWRKLLPEFIHDFTGLKPVENIVEDVSRLAEEAGLAEVTTEDVTELLDTHGQQLYNEQLQELDK